MKFDFKKIYVQRSIYEDIIWRGNAERIINRFLNAEIVEVESHWKIPELFAADAGDWMRTKRESLVLGIKSGLTHTKNGRSADFIAASNSNGCLNYNFRRRELAEFSESLAKNLPYCPIRYSF